MTEYVDGENFYTIINALTNTVDLHYQAHFMFAREMKSGIISYLGKEKDVQTLYDRLSSNYGRLHNLKTAIESYFAEWQEEQAWGKNSVDSLDVRTEAFGSLLGSLNSSSNVDYSKYPNTYAYGYSMGNRTMMDGYYEAYAYYASDEYAEIANDLWSASEYTNYKLMLDGLHDALFSGFDHQYKLDEYTDELIAGTLCNILENLPNTIPEFKTEDDIYDYLENHVNIEDLDKKVSALKAYLDMAAKLGKTKDDIKKDEDFKDLANDIDPGLFGHLCEMFGDVKDLAERAGFIVECYLCYKTNYDEQAAYLTTLKESLLSCGMYQGKTKKIFDEALRQYEDRRYMLFDKIADRAVDETVKYGTGMILEALNEGLPGISAANIILKIAQTTTKITNSKEISAAKSLAGCLPIDRSLSEVYDHYVDMMKAGIATDEDMEKAETLYTILNATRAKERDAIHTMKSYANIQRRNRRNWIIE